MFETYPDLLIPLPTIELTPDGYAIKKIIREPYLSVKCRPLGIDTKYKIPEYGKPDENNMIEAMEGWLLREAIAVLPPDAPVLTCHDEIVTLAVYLPTVRASWESGLNQLANAHS